MSPPRKGTVHKIRLLDSEWAWVNEEAERLGVTAPEVVRRAVREMRRRGENRERLRADPGSVVRIVYTDAHGNPTEPGPGPTAEDLARLAISHPAGEIRADHLGGVETLTDCIQAADPRPPTKPR